MEMALKRPASPEPVCQKRRRMSVQEVEDELNRAGMAQPAMSFVQSSNLRRKRAIDTDVPQCEIAKRSRPCSQLLPIKLGSGAGDVTLSRDIVPYHGAQTLSFGDGSPITCSKLFRPWNLCVPNHATTIAVSPDGVAFVDASFAFTDQKLLFAQFPKGWRPIIVLANGRTVEVSVFAMDRKGTVYIWSQDGQFMAEIAATRLLQDGSVAEDPPVKLLSMRDTASDGLQAVLRSCGISPLTPSTDIPDSDAEECMTECAMETD